MFIMHNHPRNSSYSYDDMAEFISIENLKTLSIIKNNGGIEILSKTKQYDVRQTIIDLRRNKKKYVINGTDEEYDKFISKTLLKLEERGYIEWIR